MCEICSGKIAKPEPPKPIIPVVTPVVEPIVEEPTPIIEETVVAEEIIEEVTTEENINEEITEEEQKEVAPVVETKAPKGKGVKGLYALVAVLMLVIVALVVVIMQDRQPDIAVNNTTLQSNTTTSTTLKQETETTTEIIEGTTVDNAGEALAPVTTTKKAQNSSKETTTKKNANSSIKETTTKKITTTTTTEANKVEFNPKVVYSKDEVYRIELSTWKDGHYLADVKVNDVCVDFDDGWGSYKIYITIEIIKLYDIVSNYGDVQEISGIEFSTIKETEVWTSDFILYAYNENGELYSEERLYLGPENGKNVKPGYTFTDFTSIDGDEIDNVIKYDLMCEEVW